MPFLTKIEEIESSPFDIDFTLGTVTKFVQKLNLYDPDYKPNSNQYQKVENVETIDPNAVFDNYDKHYLNMLGKLK
jgi:hypothetical protein